MSLSPVIDLSRLPAPNVVELLDLETIIADVLLEMRGRDVDFTALSEADPAYKLLEVAAYRELLLRQRINDAARALLLAYSRGGDLDHLGAGLDVKRLLITAADPERGIVPVYEEDDDYRERIQLAPQGFSVAGPEGAYVFHARTADPRVLDATATSPAPGQIYVTVLARDGDGAADEALLHKVEDALNVEAVRPINDEVLVVSARIVRYRIVARLKMFAGPDPSVVLKEARARIARYVVISHRLRRAPARSGIDAALHIEGVESVKLIEPTDFDPLIASAAQASYCTAIEVEAEGIDE